MIKNQTTTRARATSAKAAAKPATPENSVGVRVTAAFLSGEAGIVNAQSGMLAMMVTALKGVKPVSPAAFDADMKTTIAHQLAASKRYTPETCVTKLSVIRRAVICLTNGIKPEKGEGFAAFVARTRTDGKAIALFPAGKGTGGGRKAGAAGQAAAASSAKARAAAKKREAAARQRAISVAPNAAQRETAALTLCHGMVEAAQVAKLLLAVCTAGNGETLAKTLRALVSVQMNK